MGFWKANPWFKRQSLTFMILKHRFNPFRAENPLFSKNFKKMKINGHQNFKIKKIGKKGPFFGQKSGALQFWFLNTKNSFFWTRPCYSPWRAFFRTKFIIKIALFRAREFYFWKNLDLGQNSTSFLVRHPSSDGRRQESGRARMSEDDGRLSEGREYSPP